MDKWREGIRGMIPMRTADPLSKAIILQGIIDVMRLQPDWHFRQILNHIPDGARDDIEIAEAINQLVCSLQSEHKTDSFSCSLPAD